MFIVVQRAVLGFALGELKIDAEHVVRTPSQVAEDHTVAGAVQGQWGEVDVVQRRTHSVLSTIRYCHKGKAPHADDKRGAIECWSWVAI